MSTSAERMARLRSRRAAVQSRPRDPGSLAAGELLAPAVRETIEALGLGAADAGVAQVALQYARTIDGLKDQGFALRRFGPLLLAALEALHATPLSRASVSGPHRRR